eukprot:Gregarina_sp_Poly_1__5727@NODE_300_length_9800_cov_150_504469_g259_i0_p5_GENE_NODE_300_length_9800_cov_150_504469_g259_i0NODE_300_length_9800_cov_150_504469_g259_i0_p5_ORF_typecomplete_len146_score7_74Glyco_transf_8C/PF08437_10/1_3e02Glyco_transf_8C/PF08437_10/4_7_NODE_300_length_9800_cov_150_504469_g259_i062586695
MFGWQETRETATCWPRKSKKSTWQGQCLWSPSQRSVSNKAVTSRETAVGGKYQIWRRGCFSISDIRDSKGSRRRNEDGALGVPTVRHRVQWRRSCRLRMKQGRKILGLLCTIHVREQFQRERLCGRLTRRAVFEKQCKAQTTSYS